MCSHLSSHFRKLPKMALQRSGETVLLASFSVVCTKCVRADKDYFLFTLNRNLLERERGGAERDNGNLRCARDLGFEIRDVSIHLIRM